MDSTHSFAAEVLWTGNRGVGTAGVREYGREHTVTAAGKPQILGSAAREFRGDVQRWNPEELLIAALAQCHMLSYLYVAARGGVVVESYRDAADGTLAVESDGSGHFLEVVLRPQVTISAGDVAVAERLHRDASRLCFIAGSVNFPVRHEPVTRVNG